MFQSFTKNSRLLATKPTSSFDYFEKSSEEFLLFLKKTNLNHNYSVQTVYQPLVNKWRSTFGRITSTERAPMALQPGGAKGTAV